MAERKVLNKYYPPDCDPAKIPRRRMPKNQQIKVRTMLPMSIRCSTFGNYIYKGTKFNSRKEDVIRETYLGIQIFRFYFKCTNCSAEITMKTDPKNYDYTLELGATRNFEPWCAEDEVGEEQKRKQDAEEMGDAMKSLENRTHDSKRVMNIFSALDELKSMKSRHARVSVDAMFEALQRSAPLQQKDKFEEECEALIKSIFQGSRNVVNRIDDDELEDDDDCNGEFSQKCSKKRKVSKSIVDIPTDYLISENLNNKKKFPNGSIVLKSSAIKFSVVKKPLEAKTQETEKEEKSKTTNNGLHSLYQQYGDSDEEEE
ncbi:uncharacterized protein [Rutidosis leptorrhynchoides]|uniref:uncharacterized protein n=1 Tax=Rutidosis leptorrhynchoides TaxID=125765 RepID=UPI003A9A2263